MKRTRPRKSPPLAWKTLTKRAWKTDMGGELPEVLILKMSNAEFDIFRASEKAAKKILDDLHFLKKKLINVVFCDIVPHKGDEEWILIVTHTTHSTAAVIAWQVTC
jgi:hypothetical protein